MTDKTTLTLNKEEETESQESQYLSLIRQLLDHGHKEVGRNGTTLTTFGHMMSFSLEKGIIPILTTKKMAWKHCLKELLWFVSGKTNNRILTDQGVHIWDGNASPEYLESRGLTGYVDGELGPIYGHQWRHFNADWEGDKVDYTGKGVDQLQEIIDALKDPVKRFSRRLILSAWNPCQLNEMALPPCHILCQFNVHDTNKLSCSMYQRSIDVMLGQPFNIASYAFLTHWIAKHCDLEAYKFVYFMGNCHIYEEHIEGAKVQLSRQPYCFPKVEIKEKKERLEDYTLEDFNISGYHSHEGIPLKMIV